MNDAETEDRRPLVIFLIFLRLGLTSFGGPVAHIGYFRDEFVARRRWISEQGYANLVALCQFLPGPASSQVGMALGLSRAGYPGLVAAWIGFTMPSAIVLVLFAQGVSAAGDGLATGVLDGLKIVAVAVVAQAVWAMARNLCTDGMRITIMAIAACLVLLMPGVWTQVVVIVIAGVGGALLLGKAESTVLDVLPVVVDRRAGIAWLAFFFLLLVALPILAETFPSQVIALVDAFYRAGSLVFGGGHVVLPLLQAEVVPNGWVGHDAFLAGYGAAQAVPGPLFTFSAFLGASMTAAPTGWVGGVIALAAIFLPSFLLIAGVLPFWGMLHRNTIMQAALGGVNAAVVGLLLAALYDPVWTGSVRGAGDFGLALIALVSLAVWKLPVWLVVIGCGVAGWALAGVDPAS